LQFTSHSTAPRVASPRRGSGGRTGSIECSERTQVMILRMSSSDSGPPASLLYAAIAVPGRPRAIEPRRKTSVTDSRYCGVTSDGALSAT
jgi:hypothetical protein